MRRDTHEAVADGKSISILLFLKRMTPRIHTQ
jgi:hypothetical protein